MRVVSGSARGRRLKEPQGMDIRPTADQVKEAMFSIAREETPGARVLDAFAGTGQLGIEALSRGAAECVFCDQSPAALAIVRENVKLCGFEERAKIMRGDVKKLLPGLGKFDMILLDPPYASDNYEECLNIIFEIDILCQHGIIICESLKERQMPPARPPYEMGREYRYGSKKLTVYRRTEADNV